MDNPLLYRLWQAPFVAAKFAPIERHNDLSSVKDVLDIGCGPGTNCGYFKHSEYLGVDINPQYVEYAHRRYGRRFEVADASTYTAPSGALFDCVLLNSMLHHVDDEKARRILHQLRGTLSENGHIHIIDMILPEGPGIPRFLANSDRGDFPRRLESWEALFSEKFHPVVVEPFWVRSLGIAMWEFVYFKGSRKS